MAYVPPSTLNDLIVSWEANYSLTGGFSASLVARNPNKVIDSQALLWTSLNIETEAAVTSSLDATDAQYEGAASWVAGVVSHVDESESEVEGDEVLTIKLSSYFERLRDRPVNTETFGVGISSIINTVLSGYAGVPAALYSIATGHNATFRGVVQGDSVYSEIELLARAGWADAFVQVGGKLEIGVWKDASSSVDFALTDEAVIDIQFARTIEKAPSLIYVRGGYQSLLGCGLRVISGEPSEIPTTAKGGRDKCSIPGATGVSFDMTLKNLEGSKEAIKNAGFVLFGDTSFDSVDVPKDGEEGQATLTVKPETSGDQFDSGDLKTTRVTSLSRENDSDVNTSGSSRGKGGVERKRKQDRLTSRLTGTAPGVATGTPTLSDDQTSDSADKGRLNFGLVDTTLASDYGVVSGSVDNTYITNGMVAFRAAIREFQETRMRRRTYELKTVYIPLLRINHVITFKDKAENTIKGRIVGIKTSWSVETSEVTMNLTVESFEDLGALTYQSDNLLVYPELCGINGVDWAVASGTVWAVGSGFFAFDGVATVNQSLILIPTVTYTVSFTLTLISATGTFVATLGPGSSTIITASGDYTFVAVPLVEANTLSFQSTLGEWLLSKPRLVATVTNF